jgi:hypothetical protein
MDRDGFGSHIGDEGFIDWKGGAGVNDLISGVTVGLLAQSDGRLGSGKDDDPLGRSLNPPGLTQVFGDGLPKRENALGVAIVGIIQVDLTLHLVLDMLRNGEIGFSQVALDHLLPLVFEELDLGAYLEGVLRINQSNSLRKQSHVNLLSKRDALKPSRHDPETSKMFEDLCG